MVILYSFIKRIVGQSKMMSYCKNKIIDFARARVCVRACVCARIRSF